MSFLVFFVLKNALASNGAIQMGVLRQRQKMQSSLSPVQTHWAAIVSEGVHRQVGRENRGVGAKGETGVGAKDG